MAKHLIIAAFHYHGTDTESECLHKHIIDSAFHKALGEYRGGICAHSFRGKVQPSAGLPKIPEEWTGTRTNDDIMPSLEQAYKLPDEFEVAYTMLGWTLRSVVGETSLVISDDEAHNLLGHMIAHRNARLGSKLEGDAGDE